MIINVNQHYFEVIENYNDAFNQEMFDHRYSEILDRYPYVVGDIGFEQLRLKGFFEDNKKGADISKRFSAIQDYLLEYCNFGCPYFVLRRLNESEIIKLTNKDEISDVVGSNHEVIVEKPKVIEETSQQLDETKDSNLAPSQLNTMKKLSDFIK